MEKNSIFSYKLAYDGEFVDVDKQKTIKWDSKRFNIEWPCTNPLISKRDEMETILNLENHQDRWQGSNWTSQDLIDFEDDIISHWENGEIRGPIHLSNGNEEQLIKIFSKIGVDDWVFSTWRSHYHALLRGVEPKVLKQKILDGKSITIIDKNSNFYSSAIVNGIIPMALGVVKQM